MRRRDFGRLLASAAVGSALPGLSNQQPMGETAPFKVSIMLWTVFRELPFVERLENVASAGYQFVELVSEYRGWADSEFSQLAARSRQLGIEFDAISGLKHGAADPGARDAFLEELKTLLPVAQRLNCPAIIVLSGNRVDTISREQQHQACVETLKRASDLAERNHVRLLLENIDPLENPKYFLTSVAEGFEIVRSVDHPSIRFLYDFFHEQIAEGNLIAKLQKNIDLVGLVHVADVPGRHQPGTGEINYDNIYRALAALKYDRVIAMEFEPIGNAVEVLRSARQQVQGTPKSINLAVSRPLRSG